MTGEPARLTAEGRLEEIKRIHKERDGWYAVEGIANAADSAHQHRGELLAMLAAQAQRDAEAVAIARDEGRAEGIHVGAGLLTALKLECEKQHARAAAAEQETARLREKYHDQG